MNEILNNKPDRNQPSLPTTVFFSYSRADQAAALPLIKIIEDAGFNVWWDGMISGGTSFLETTEEALESAKAVVVLWSQTSVQSHWVRDEATSGRDRKVMVPLSLDGTMAPLGFRQVQLIKLESEQNKKTDTPILNMLSAIADLHEEGPHSSVPILDYVPAKSLRTPWQMSRRYVFLGGGLMVGAAAVSTLYRSGTLAPSFKPIENSIAVLPFDNLSGNADYDYIAGGLSSEIRNSLSLNRALKVAGKSSSRAVMKEGVSILQISKMLNVSSLIEGGFNVVNNTVRVTVNFIDGQTGFNQWVNKFEDSLDNILTLHDAITSAVYETFTLSIRDKGKVDVGQTENAGAFSEYIKAQNEVTRSLDKDAIDRAISHYNTAIEMDPSFGSAFISKSQLLLWKAFSAKDVGSANRLKTAALATAQTATKVSPNFESAHNNLGYVYFFTNLDIPKARISFKKAESLGGGVSSSLARLATFSAHVKNDKTALEAANKAKTLDPLNPAIHETLGYVHYCAGRFAKSILSYQRALELRASHSGPFALMARAHFELGQIDKGLALCESETSSLERLPCLAIGLDKKGQSENSEIYLNELINTYNDVSAYQQAQIYANRGNIPKAIKSLDKAFATKDAGLALLYSDPNMKNLQGNSHYNDLLAKIGFTK